MISKKLLRSLISCVVKLAGKFKVLESESVPPKVDPAIAAFNFVVIRLLLSTLAIETAGAGTPDFLAAP